MRIQIILMLFLVSTVVAQSEKATISVRGNCGMCKARIEKAAIKTKGVKYAVWQAATETLTLLYNTKKTTVKQVATNIAAVGHEANGIVATDKVYDDLPLCCRYVRGKPMVIGHRGAMGHAPENTLPSVRAALQLGVDAIEIDVFRIASGELVVFHDATLQKLTNGKGRIEEKTLDELSTLLVMGSAKIPTLSEVLLEINGAVAVNVELKGANTAQGTIALFDDFVSNGIFSPEQLYVSSFDWDELREFRALTKAYAVAVLTDKNPLDAVDIAYELDADAINPNFKQLNADIVHTLQAYGLKVIPYTVNDPQTIAALTAMGVNGIITDYPERIIE